jgi:hypothetical protein
MGEADRRDLYEGWQRAVARAIYEEEIKRLGD